MLATRHQARQQGVTRQAHGASTRPACLPLSKAGPQQQLQPSTTTISTPVVEARAASRGMRLHAAPEGSSASTATATAEVAGLLELNADTFYDHIDVCAKAGTLLIVDFFTQRCGPCKLIYSDLVKLNAELTPAASIVKFDCNATNKELAKAVGIRVAPTFHIYKNGAKVAEMTGAKVQKLKDLIAEHLDQN